MKVRFVIFSILCIIGSCGIHEKAVGSEVVVYTALDQVFSEPVLVQFQQETGIEVRAVYDIEATKTTGLVNRLIAEARNPHCDVFWNNEIMNTIALKRQGLLAVYRSPAAEGLPNPYKDPEGYWCGFAARSRVLVVNVRRLSAAEYPRSIFDLVRPRWQEKTAMANPLFGTTATHVAAWFSFFGPEKAKAYLLALKANGVQIVDGNSVVRDQVGAGELSAGFTDTDDVNTGILAGKPIRAVYPDQDGFGTLLIPNTVALVAKGPNPENGKRLIDYLLSAEVEKTLAFSSSVQMPLRPGVPVPDGVKRADEIKTMAVNYEDVADHREASIRFVQEVFIR